MKRKLLSLFLSLALLLSLAAPALAAETASVIRLTKTAGTVEISKSSGKSISLLQNMRLYNGYHVSTDEESYAWINLDDSKLLKEDAESEVEVRKDGKNLEVLVASGNVFFDVARDLEDDESLNIRTSTMAVGIRGTSGWLHVVDRWVTRVSVLEGTVECSVADPVTGEIKAEEVRGGETVLCVVYPQEKEGGKSAILRDKFTVEDIPGFVLTDLVRDMALCDKIEAATGLDIPRNLAAVAGGDPSGREPDREHATPEVLGEADRREDEDEDALRDKLEEIEKELEKQPDKVSPDKPIEKPAPSAPPDSGSDRDDDSGSGSDSGTTTPDPTPPEPTPVTYTVTFNANGGEWSGETERTVQTAADGTVTLPEAPTRSGYSFSGWYDAPEGGTELPAGSVFTADAAVYAHWTENAPPPPPTYTVTFDANGGTPVSSVQTDTSGKPTSWPVAPTYPMPATPDQGTGLTFVGWYTADNVQKELTDTFTANTTLIAHWDGWFIDNGKLTAAGDVVESTYDDWFYGPTAPWYLSSITEIVIPRGVTTIGNYAFQRCSGPTSVTIPDGVTSIGNGAFWDCSDLTSVSIPDSVTSIGSTAFDGSSLTSVSIPDSVTSIGSNAFDGTDLTSVSIPDGVTAIERATFEFCRDLASVSIPDSVTSIGEQAFYGCSSLTSVSIPDNVKSIGNNAFRDCSGLESVTIPSSVTSIGGNAFNGCTALVEIRFDGTAAEWTALKPNISSSAIPSGVKIFDKSGALIESI